jgi:hypothetical protein
MKKLVWQYLNWSGRQELTPADVETEVYSESNAIIIWKPVGVGVRPLPTRLSLMELTLFFSEKAERARAQVIKLTTKG